MKYWTKLAITVALMSGTALAEQFTGWIADAKCAKSGHYKGDGHQKCVSAGEPLVFVDEADGAVYAIVDPDRVKDSLGKRVTLSGDLKDDKIEAEAVTVIVGREEK